MARKEKKIKTGAVPEAQRIIGQDNEPNNEQDSTEQDANNIDNQEMTFSKLGVIAPICEACENLKFTKPTPIQIQSIPLALEGRDVIGLAQTGSGKTAAFAIPILQALWQKPSPLFACVLAPTRELAYQISEQFDALGEPIGLRCAVVVGGMDMMSQALALSKRPHVIVATPGRLMDHLEHTKGFNLKGLKYLVMDEADRLLDMDFGPIIDKLLQLIPTERRTLLFSATMTSKVEKLQRASLASPVRVAVSTKYETVKTLLQSYIFFPFKHKDTYLVYLVNEMAGQSIIIFARTCNDTERLALLLRSLGFPAVPLHGQMSQSARLGALSKFKSGARSILVATDVAARGLDIPAVDVVLNYDIPTDSKAYIHRVGRTARAGRAGKSISLVTQYDLELYLRIEGVLGKKLDEYAVDREAVMLLSERVGEAQREAINEMKALHAKRKGKKSEGITHGKRRRDDMDREES
ncbi:P-loop containing nucleoside triphosphate hydrolase protein [Lipomyces oligophaga]|uniref:P-loop containing nucleoside triphosphate hydrolase protein n=1 Tax=Lipomyces oligophaga TaxID=45792 RepID=UPI0034CE9B83